MSLLKELPDIKSKSGWPWEKETSSTFYSIDINWPKISIVTPSFNQSEYIEETIRSILLQNYPNLEYIIIDGGSSDNTTEIIKKYEKYISYWVSEPDRGQAHAINKGLEKCTGEVFNWINSDDYLEPNSLLEIGRHFFENKQTQVLCGYTHCYFQETGKTSHTYQMGIKPTVADTILNVEMNQPGSFYRMDVVKRLGGVNETLRYVFDDELWFKYLCKFGLKHIDFTEQLLVQFRLHGSSKSVGEGYTKFNQEISEIYLEMGKQLNLPAEIIELMRKEAVTNRYKTNEWSFNHIEKETFLAYFCNKFQYIFYKDFKYSEAKKAFQAQKNYFKANNKSRTLYIKLYLIPRFVLKFLRKR